MPMVIFNIDRELKKAAQGKKTKVDIVTVLLMATRPYPEVRAGIVRAFGITEWDMYGHRLDAHGKRIRKPARRRNAAA
jgi:hypothetical protein